MRQIICLVMFLLFASQVVAAEEKKTIAILDFEFGSVQKWWEGNWDVGRGVSDLVVNALLAKGTYRLVERKRLDAVLAEQNLAGSDRAASSAPSQIGKVLGVNAFITGSVTQFGTENKDSKVGAVAGKLFSGLGGGLFGKKKSKARVGVTARLVDGSTGEILASAEGFGESKREGFLLGGLGVSDGTLAAGGIDMGSSDFRETILGEAVHAAVDDLVRQITSLESKVNSTRPEIRGMIADVTDGVVTLNVGSRQGVRVGDEFVALEVLRVIKDPQTDQVLREITQEHGTLRVVELGDAWSTAVVVSGKAETGYVVKSRF